VSYAVAVGKYRSRQKDGKRRGRGRDGDTGSSATEANVSLRSCVTYAREQCHTWLKRGSIKTSEGAKGEDKSPWKRQ